MLVGVDGPRTGLVGTQGNEVGHAVRVEGGMVAQVLTVYLLGCDFKMPTAGAPYAFDQDKSESGRASNNHAYRVHAKRLESPAAERV